jgi:hypothetical protein
LIEGPFTVQIEVESSFFLRKSYYRGYQRREVIDKPLVEIGKSYKGSYVLYVAQVLLVQDSVNLAQVHPNAFHRDYVTEIGYLCLVEFALIYVELQTCFFHSF